MDSPQASGSMRRASSSLIWLLLRVIALVSVVLLVECPEDRSRAGDGVARLLQSDACAVGAVRPAPRLVLRVAPPPAPGAVSSGLRRFCRGLSSYLRSRRRPLPIRFSPENFVVTFKRHIPRMKPAEPPLSDVS